MTTQLSHPDLGNGLTNHQPMVISALKELGASQAHINRYTSQYQSRVKPVSDQFSPIDNDQALVALLGKQENYRGIFELFRTRLQQLGARQLVNTYIPLLAEGVAGGALHPIIRLGHAIHDNDDSEIIAALSYWVWTYQSLPWPENTKPKNRNPVAVIQTLLEGVNWPTEEELNGPMITAELDNVVAVPAYQSLSFELEEDVLTLPLLQKLSITLFWMHDDFTLLHAVTGVHALSRVAKWLDNPEILFAPIWKTVIVSWLTKNLRWQESAAVDGEPRLSLREIKTLAANAVDAHTVKLVAAALDSYEQTGNKLFWFAAERRIFSDTQTSQMI